MSLKNFTEIFEFAIANMNDSGSDLTFVHGATELQNIVADKISTYPCIFLDSPRKGEIEIKKVGVMMIGYTITFAVLDRTELDDSADNVREVLQNMGEYALRMLSAVASSFRQHEDVKGIWTELDGVFDAHLTGWMIEFTVFAPSTDYIEC